ncbi:hypothetical protein [Bdellovibrio sp. HCB209]|uniref:hypothetical protein n=1 Tax=Bdellovibrio sp. HCB209 TaxID=3394354 RepID=UPI0039B60A20
MAGKRIWSQWAKQRYSIYREHILADLRAQDVDTTYCGVDKTKFFEVLNEETQSAILYNMRELSCILRETAADTKTPRNLQLLWSFFKQKGIAIDYSIFEGLSPDVHFDVYDMDGNCKMISPRIFEITQCSVDEVFCKGAGSLHPLDRVGSQTLRLVKNVKIRSKYEGWSGFCTLSEPLQKQ